GGDPLAARLETHASGYRLRVEPGELDGEAFEAEVAAAERLGPADPGSAVTALRRALARWRGDVDAGGSESAAAGGAITRLEELRLGASETLAELNLQLGRPRDVAADLEPLAREHPFRERFHALLMIALYRSGRQADALVAYRTARGALVDELGVEPGPELRALELAVLRQDPGLMGSPGSAATAALDDQPGPARSAAAAAALHGTPPIDTPFIGRQAELAAVVELLDVERLVTISGVGGAGKTRFAIQAATQALGRFPSGAWFVDLTPVPDGERLPLAVAASLGIAEQAGRGIGETIVDSLRDARRLLILDNCEHVVDPCARFVEALLDGAPDLVILATSREPLRLSSEVLWRLAPLDVPAVTAGPNARGDVDVLASDAVRLLLDRAGRVRPGRAWTDSDLAAMDQICHRLDGLPLAIEMAAARLRVLEPQDVLDRLDDRFRLLTDGGRTAIPRHRSRPPCRRPRSKWSAAARTSMRSRQPSAWQIARSPSPPWGPTAGAASACSIRFASTAASNSGQAGRSRRSPSATWPTGPQLPRQPSSSATRTGTSRPTPSSARSASCAWRWTGRMRSIPEWSWPWRADWAGSGSTTPT
ncbi:MAG: hypothetical protein HY264_04430, partial [Chloroflexi bacterium]|nr:hypothetical protein [Chloroflexota bacterium]